MLHNNWLVLGANGYFGLKIVEELKKKKYSFTAIDRNIKNVSSHLIQYFKELDVKNKREFQYLLETFRPCVIVNAIGHGLSTSEKDLTDIYLGCTEYFLSLVKKIIPQSRVILIGSAAEYGNTLENAKSKETDPTFPISLYGKIKVKQNQIAEEYYHRGLHVVVARVFNTVGPDQGSNLVAGALFKRLKNGERPLMVRATNYIRDFLDVRDVTRAIVSIGDAQNIPSPVINICSGQEYTIGELAYEIVELCGGILQPIPQSFHSDQLWRSVGDNTVLRRLGWNVEIDMNQSLHDQWKTAGSPIQQKPK